MLELLLAPVEIAIPEGQEEIAAELESAGGERHRLQVEMADLDGYATTGLPARTMGRDLSDDPLFFAAALAAGAALRQEV